VVGRSRRALSLVGAALAATLVGLTPAPAHAAAGTVTEYPIPVSTTPYGMGVGPDGNIWFVDSGNHVGSPSVGRMTTSGSISSADVVSLPTTDLGGAVTLGPDGNMWVAQGGHVDKVPVGVTATSQITSYATGTGSGGYLSIVAGPDGRLWFDEGNSIGSITTGGTLSSYPTGSTSGTSSVIAGPDGKLWFGEPDKIARMDTAGQIGAGDQFALPAGDGDVNALVLGPDGNVWFTLGAPAAVGRITPAGVITVFPTPTAGSLPFGLAVGPDRRIWFPERNADQIASIPTTASSGADITEYPLTGTNLGVLYITTGPDNRMWFDEFNRNQLGAITAADPPPVAGPPPAPPAPPAPGVAPAPPVTGPAAPIQSPPNSGAHPPAASVSAPVMTRLRISPAGFFAAAAGPSTTGGGRRTAKPRSGATVTYALSAAATVRFTVWRRVPGRRQGHGHRRCVAPSPHNRRTHRCTRTLVVPGSFTHAGTSSANRLHFSGRLNGRRLPDGTYTLVATPAVGTRTGRAVTVAFRIIGRT
jgi:virginiamycin B lyase